MNTKNNYLLPIYERFIDTINFGGHQTCLHIDEVGVFIRHDGTQVLTTDYIRHFLVGRRRTFCVVEAETVGLAIRKFYDEWDGANIGGENEHAKALWIDRVDDQGRPTQKAIEELPPCAMIHRNKEGSITCGRPIHDIQDHEEKDDESINMNGEFGMCGLEGYDYPEEDCPMNDYSDINDTLPIRTVTVNGMVFRYTSWKDAEEAIRLKKEKEAEKQRSKQIQETKIYQRLVQVEL